MLGIHRTVVGKFHVAGAKVPSSLDGVVADEDWSRARAGRLGFTYCPLLLVMSMVPPR